ncbi:MULTISPECIES: zincin-like metallopeptidase domain-containing protein [Alcaligenaceae]|jgi:antirestriction protein ArdC|uniref:Polyvalent protein metallopeptidase domain-containing protein n=1 Tax=Kerstersia gyiorum TaxID=206506 RepID=A0A171KW19_9BURK|nr:zincin-like metallopeptidase domain-containing protein [Kerstersia gyiorum]AZV94733.1 hypothetical protein CBF45_14235 [Bordetella sp. J329]MDK7585584.1 zincin-like metallopeptidase domain-containing protein [Alcaligenes phenolicus]WCX76310.1 hypothetical protein KK211_25645 [Pseudomonas aeruginosa]KAB0545132.1 hypothetical protein F7P85_02245 [Kerstersia gyiorum]KKO73086.1 hypothetical protein AAV32_01920 [Kerstersia gyiorum]
MTNITTYGQKHQNRAGLSGYVAELGAAFLSARLGITAEPREDHAKYLASWIKVLKDDRKAFITAASKAAEASDYLLALANQEQKQAA